MLIYLQVCTNGEFREKEQQVGNWRGRKAQGNKCRGVVFPISICPTGFEQSAVNTSSVDCVTFIQKEERTEKEEAAAS